MQNVDSVSPKVIRFFVEFSRLEYALTRCSETLCQKKGIAEPDWSRLAILLGESFLEISKGDALTSILWENPPRQWMTEQQKDGQYKAKWLHRVAPVELEKSLEPLKWVRNCVFHGESQEIEPRYDNLLDAALVLIERIVENCKAHHKLSAVAENFEKASLRGR